MLDRMQITTEAEYEDAPQEAGLLMDARVGTPDVDRLDALADAIVTYEAEHRPVGPPVRDPSGCSLPKVTNRRVSFGAGVCFARPIAGQVGSGSVRRYHETCVHDSSIHAKLSGVTSNLPGE